MEEARLTIPRGAGVAGVTAAVSLSFPCRLRVSTHSMLINALQKTLSDSGIDDFLLVEYQDRIGGRMHDVRFGNGSQGNPYIVEAGANWVGF